MDRDRRWSLLLHRVAYGFRWAGTVRDQMVEVRAELAGQAAALEQIGAAAGLTPEQVQAIVAEQVGRIRVTLELEAEQEGASA